MKKMKNSVFFNSVAPVSVFINTIISNFNE